MGLTYRQRLKRRRLIKQAAQWAAFFVLAAAAVLAASFIGAELAQAPAQAAWALGKLGLVLVGVISLMGLVCSMVED